jgi:hypothetical protein
MKIISGGQTGVDRAALDTAIELGMEYGGCIPRGRRAEDGPIDGKYDRLTELESPSYSTRTERNAVDGDATLIFTSGPPTEGTAYTVECAKKHGRPYLLVDLFGEKDEEARERIVKWLGETGPGVLNIGGPRESKVPGIYARTRRILRAVLKGR